MPIEGHAGKIQLVIRNKNEMSQFWNWASFTGYGSADGDGIEDGQRVTVTNKPAGFLFLLQSITV